MRVLWGLGFALVVALGFWVSFRPTDVVEGGETAGILEHSATLPAVTTPQPTPAVAGPAPAPAPAPAPPSVPASVPAPAASNQAAPARAALNAASSEEIAVAASVLHRPWTEVSVLIGQSGIPDARKRMYAAVSCAVAGDRERALKFAQGLDKSDELDSRERALVLSAVAGTAVAALPAGASADSIGAVGMALTLRARDAALALAAGRSVEAAQAYSEVLLADATATWPSDRTALQRWTDGLTQAQRGHRWSVKGNWPSVQATVKAGDSLTLIRQRAIKEHPELLVCTGLIERANQLRNEKDLHPGDVLRIPTERAHMLVDISTRWVMYMMGDEIVAAWEGGVGKPGNETLPGQYKIGVKQKNPSWFRSGAPLVPFGDPENPLGTRWLSWQTNGVESHLGFHGTTDPNTVGGAVSSGCIRMRNEDVELLYEILPEKAGVVVQP